MEANGMGRLEARVLIISESEEIKRPDIKGALFDVPGMSIDLQIGSSIDEQIKEWDVIFYFDDAKLMEKNAEILKENIEVPVIFYMRRQGECDSEKLVERYNLHSATDDLDMDEILREAFAVRKNIKSFLKASPGAEERIRRSTGRNYFQQATKLAELFAQKREPLLRITNNFELAARYMHMSLLARFQVAHFIEDEKDRDDYVRNEIMTYLVDFLEVRDLLKKNEALKSLGDGESGEDDVGLAGDDASASHIALIDPPPRYEIVPQEFRQKLFIHRIIDPKEGLMRPDAMAEQRFRDAEYYRQKKGGLFKPRMILRPIHLTDYPRIVETYGHNESVMFVEWVQGEPVRTVLEKLNQSHKICRTKTTLAQRQSHIEALRDELVDIGLEHCIEWVNDEQPFCDRVPKEKREKPLPKNLKGYYIENLKKIPDNINRFTNIVFSDKELELWDQAMRIIERMSIRKEDIVRNRDSSLGNAILRLEEEWKEENIKDFIVNGEVDREKLEGRIVPIDTQFQWRHCLDDPCQIFTWYEARFLLYERDETGGIVFPERKRRLVSRKKDEYLDRIGKGHLKGDEFAFASMMFYRSARKMNLFLRYWDKTCKIASQGDIGKDDFSQRCRRFEANIRHYNSTSQMFAQQMGREASQEITSDSQEAYMRAIYSARSHSSHALDEERAGEYLKLIESSAESKSTADTIRAYALRSVFKKLLNEKFKLVNPYDRGDSHA